MWKNEIDERLAKEVNSLIAKMYYVITLLTAFVMIIKIYNSLPVYVYGLEILMLVAGTSYVLIKKLSKGILFIKNPDEALQDINEEILSKAFNIMFWIVILGEFFYLFILRKYFFWIISYLIIWMIPAFIITVASVKNGWLLWGTKKREKTGVKNLRSRTIIASLFYGIIMGFHFLFNNGAFNPKGILWILGLSAGWGIPFYFIFLGLMKVSENKANKKVESGENKIEE